MLNLLIDIDKLDKFIIRLIIFVNNHHKYNNIYIKKNYNLNSHKEFVVFFKNNYKKKILFSSLESEQLFINFLNIDFNFLLKKYREFYPIKILNFCISKKKFYFNYCHYSNTNKHIKDLCCCNIKVKTIVNLSIKSLIFILKQNYKKINTSQSSQSTQLLSSHLDINIKNNSPIISSTIHSNNTVKSKQPNVIKITNNNETKDLIKCFHNLEKANQKLGLDIIDNHYTIESESITNEHFKNKPFKPKKNNVSKFNVVSLKSSEELPDFFNKQKNENLINNLDHKSYSNHINQFSSESINIFNDKIIDSDENSDLNNKNIKDKSNNKLKTKLNSELIDVSKLNNELSNEVKLSNEIKLSNELCSKSSNESSKSSNESSKSDNESSKSSNESSKSDNESDNESKSKSKYKNNFNELNKKEKIKKCIDLIIKKLQINNNILFENNNLNNVCINLKKIIKSIYPIELASKFDRIYQKTILTNKMSDTNDMEKYGNLIIQLNEFKNLL